MRDASRKSAFRLIPVLVIMALFMPVTADAGKELTGLPFVADGDTLGFAERRVRLYGIDAPEAEQTCIMLGQDAPIGQWATKTLRRLIGRETVTCYPLGRSQGQHMVARCRTPKLGDISRAMVAAGFAWDYKKQSRGIYSDVQAQAFKGRLGIWAGGAPCMPPWEWRRR
ncbi:MAG: thermonuclease family protein [Rhodospirillales bacterium]|nr:thermonuclease family protein [Rhodospirillales bacterium]